MNGPNDAHPVQEPAGDTSAPKKKKRDKVRSAWISFVGRIVAQVIGAVATVALGVLVLQRMQSAPEPNEAQQAAARTAARARTGLVSIAVLPLDNFSGDPSQEYFADGMTEALIANLAQVQGLHVISRTSVMRYKGQRPSLEQISEQLGVDLIVEGSVVKSGERVRISAQLIDTSSDSHLWARTYDRTLSDVLTLQAEVATAIVTELEGALPVDATRRLAEGKRAVDPAVYDLYLRGRQAWNLRTPEGFRTAIEHFEEAIRIDPDFALAHAGLADVYSLGGSPSAAITNPRENFIKAKAAALRALALEPNLAEAHTSLAAVHFFGEHDVQGATREFERALQLNPGYPTAHQWYAVALAEQGGREMEALAHAQQAVKLDPLSGTRNQSLGFVHYYARRYEEAIRAQQRALELNPTLPLARVVLAKSLVLAGRPEQVPAVVAAAPAQPHDDLVMALGLAHLKSGNRVEAERMLAQLLAKRPVPLATLAQWYAATGDHNTAMTMLRRLVTSGNVPVVLQVDPMFDALRADARFTEILRRASARETRGL